MRKATFAIASVAIAAAFTFVTVTDADAQRRRRGGAVAAGVIGGIAAGAIIGGALAGSRPAYSEPRPVYRRSCWEERRRWSNRRQAWIIERYRVC